jgi:PAS domain S-box-containing protein
VDITERKQAENAARRSAAFLAEGQRLSHTGSWGWDALTGKVSWSDEFFRILGLHPRDTKSALKLFWERVHPDDRNIVRRTFESAIRDNKDFEQEFRIVRPDRSIRYLHGVGQAVLNEATELAEFVGSVMDITERKRAEEQAQSQRGAIKLALNAFVEELDVNRFLGDVISEITKRFRPESWELWVFDEALGELRLQLSGRSADSDNSGVSYRNIGYPGQLSDVGSSGRFGRTPQVFEFPVKESTPMSQHFEMLHAEGVKTLVLVPLVIGEQSLGFLELHFRSLGKFTTEDLELAQALANHAILALQLNRLARRAEQLAVAEERNRLAREIHDTMAQEFAGIVLHSEVLGTSLAVSRRRSRKALSQIQRLARSGLDEARRSVQALRPKALEGSSLSQALEGEANRLNASGRILCHFRRRGEIRELQLEAQNELFRIAQEALTNVSKHAQANTVWISLTFTSREISLAVRDDGVGLAATAAQKPKRTYGHISMRERAQRIGGQLQIKSAKSGGTSVHVRVPLVTNNQSLRS